MSKIVHFSKFSCIIGSVIFLLTTSIFPEILAAEAKKISTENNQQSLPLKTKVENTNNNNNIVGKVIRNNPDNISYNATDLQVESTPKIKANTTYDQPIITNFSNYNALLANYDVDLDVFCSSYPLNSRCTNYKAPNGQPVNPPQSTEKPGETAPKTPEKTTSARKFAVTGKLSTLGVGVEATTQIYKSLNARLGLNYLGFGISPKQQDIQYQGDLNLFSVTALADYYPFGGNGLRFSGGLAYQDNRASVTGQASNGGTFTINHQTFNAAEVGTLKGELTFPNSIAPYLGIGFGNPVRSRGFGFTADVGVIFVGSPTVSLTTQSNIPLTPKQQNTLNSALRGEEQKIQNDLDGLNIYPVVSLGVFYSF